MPINTFELIDETAIASLGLRFSEYLHPATGARHYHLASADDNNAFMVAFPTLPDDSTGVAHILEHTTLCGSARYPVRDPFFMMLRRSLNTYMNAFTSGDSTAYPFATQNRKDFDNLLGVYLDAVFFPRLHPLDFAQEGWRLELREDATKELEYHGVVYNEMKGAMSSPLAQLWHHVHATLFPDAVYRHNSGGDPLAIPNLTHAQLTAFHARHYHPSNAVFMTYGNFPAAEHQARFEELSLARFHDTRAPLVSPLQPRFDGPHEVVTTYQADDLDTRATHIVWGWMFAETSDVAALIDAHLLSSVLLEHSASPLRHYLEATELANAPSELCGIDDSARQVVFVCGVEGSDPEHAEALERGILDVMTSLAEHGTDIEVLRGCVDRIEMAQRDIGGDSYPFGLQLMGRILPAAMYRGDPRRALDLDPVLERLRMAIESPQYVRNLARRLLLDNPHRVRVVMTPDQTRAARDAAEEAERLARLRASLSDEELQALSEQAQSLRERQAIVDDDSVLPRVTLADVPDARLLMKASAHAGHDDSVSEYECAANGVFRARMAYQLPALSPAELRVLPLWCEYATEFGSGTADYLEVQARRALVGAFSVYALTRPTLAGDGSLHAWVIVGGKGLARKRDEVLNQVQEMVRGVRFDEHERLHELLQQSRAEAEQSITDRGHQLAVLSAARSLSPAAALDELWDGPSAIQLLKSLGQERRDPRALEELFATFASIREKLAIAPRVFALIGDADTLRGASEQCDSSASIPVNRATFVPEIGATAHADVWVSNSQVNFCAKAYRAEYEGAPQAPALAVLGRYLQDGFLHREIREQGGAYGSGAAYDADSATFRFFSYRDPRTLETFRDFDRALAWFAGERDAQRLEESILGTIRAIDQPRSPAGEAERAFVARLCGRDDASRRAFRSGVLGVGLEALQAAAERYLVSAEGQRAAVCAPTNEATLVETGLTAQRL